MRRLCSILSCVLAIVPALAQTTRPWVGKNSKLVTVCSASACDYQTIQAALDGTTGTSSAPVTILVMPGTYTECVNLAHDDDYKTIAGTGRESVVVSCATSGEHTFQFAAGASDLEDFAVEDMTVQISPGTGATRPFTFSASSSDTRFDLRLSRLRINSDNTSGGIANIFGSNVSIPTGSPSVFRVNDSVMDAAFGIVVADHLSVYSADNEITLSNPTATEAKCWGDHGASATYIGTEFRSVNDRCIASSLCVSDVDCTGAVDFYYGAQDGLVIGMTAFLSVEAAATIGPRCFRSGWASAASQGTMEVVSSSCEYSTTSSGQTAYCVDVAHDGRMIVRDVRCNGIGPGTEYDVGMDSSTTDVSYLRYENFTFNTTELGGSGDFSALNPSIVCSTLRAVNSVALPATGAPLDVNGEFRLYDAAADENASWRTLRVSDLYDSMSLYAPKFRVYWKPVLATSGSAVWRVGICAAAQDEAYPCTVSSFSSVTDTVTGGAAGDLYISDWTALPTGILSAGKSLVVTASRDADNGSDGMTDDAALGAVEICYGVR